MSCSTSPGATHHVGCECHEARWRHLLGEQEALALRYLARADDADRLYLALAGANDVHLVERDAVRAEVERLRSAAAAVVEAWGRGPDWAGSERCICDLDELLQSRPGTTSAESEDP